MIVRTPARLEGGLTDEERTKLEIHAKRWIDVAYQTGQTNRQKLVKAIEGIYWASDLPKPVVEIVPSPMGMTRRYSTDYEGIGCRTCAITRVATRDRLSKTIAESTDQECCYAVATSRHLVGRQINDAIRDCLGFFDEPPSFQGGNLWSADACFLTAFRDVLGLQLSAYHRYAYWEEAALYGGARLMLPNCCIVCDFPEVIRVDANYRPHCNDGPSHRWSDGKSLWHLNGVRVDEQLVLRPKTQTLQQIDGEPNEDLKVIRIERFGWPEYLRESGASLLDERHNEIEGTREALYRQRSGDLRLVATCPTGRHPFALRVGDYRIRTCEGAQNWLAGEKPFRTLART
jgi:hypothetical protein